MVNTMYEKNGASSFLNLIKNLIKFVQVFCMFYAFFSIVYWLLYTSKVEGVENFFWLFKPSWDFVGLFYTYKPTISDELVDFTGVISAIIFIILANSVKFLYEFLADIETKIETWSRKKPSTTDKILSKKNTSSQIRANTKKTLLKEPSNFLFLLDVKITNLSNFIQEEKMTPEEIEKMKNKFHQALLNNINQNQIKQKGLYKKKLYLIYKDFSNVDNFIFYTRETLNSLSKEFLKPTLRIDFLVALGSLAPSDDLTKEISVLDTIICLNLQNEFIATSAFKNIYFNQEKKHYKLVTKGVYNLSKNLHVTNNQEIYSLREN
ncbi:MAG: hypothetical protein PHV37_06770 [Candidatus Gastranaerophilales bacterium]|nr:hypothetical protein [Candidatus Gastranaerophilales bacterium]